MSCSPYTPCHETTCNECNTVNPCYDNCGCLNPVDFECVNNPGTQSALGVVNTDNGKEVLEKINTKISDLLSKVGLSKVDGSDTCPDTLEEKIVAGNENVTIEVTGTGCAKVLEISVGDGIGTAGNNNKVSVSASDTTTDFLTGKLAVGNFLTKTIVNPAGDEDLRLDVSIPSLISTDSSNQIVLGSDNKLKVIAGVADGSETKIVQGTGCTVTGAGTIGSPYIISSNPTITAAKACFDGVWKNITFNGTYPANLSFVAGVPQYRKRFDGTIEFRGSATFQTQFPAGGSGTILAANLSTTLAINEISGCYSLSNLANTSDLKSVTYNDSNNILGTPLKQTTYTIRFGSGNITLLFHSTIDTTVAKTITVNFDGAMYHPNL
jgi:hypothetical protein